MKRLTLLFASLALTACSPSYQALTYSAIPTELADCKFYRLSSGNGDQIQVARCPMSITSVASRSGKTTNYAITVDGVDYVKANK